jgi:hypothetical protein
MSAQPVARSGHGYFYEYTYALTIITILAVGPDGAGFFDLPPPAITQGLEDRGIEEVNEILGEHLYKSPQKVDELELRLDELEQRLKELGKLRISPSSR